MSKKSQQIGEYFENSFQVHLSKLYGIISSINLSTVSNNLGLTSSEKSTADSDANDTAIRVKRKISDYYGTDIPSRIILVPKNPKVDFLMDYILNLMMVIHLTFCWNFPKKLFQKKNTLVYH
jgi:hypothetical protein